MQRMRGYTTTEIPDVHKGEKAMNRIAAKKLRDGMSDALNRVAYTGERIVIERRGKGAAVLVSMEDAELLEGLEDRIDLEQARKALKSGKPIALEAVKKELGL